MFLEQIIVLALIQGITEFLPISSSGHLILVPALTGWKDQGLLTDMVTNVGSLAAVVIYFWRDVMGMFRGALDVVQRRWTYNAGMLVNVAVGTVPIVVVGLLMKFLGLEEHIRSTTLVAVNAIVFGILLYAADPLAFSPAPCATWVGRRPIIGLAQAFSLSPGTSRSGVTMTAARALGYSRPEAARFSFLLSIPANAAASVLVIGDALSSGESLQWRRDHDGCADILCGAGRHPLPHAHAAHDELPALRNLPRHSRRSVAGSDLFRRATWRRELTFFAEAIKVTGNNRRKTAGADTKSGKVTAFSLGRSTDHIVF